MDAEVAGAATHCRIPPLSCVPGAGENEIVRHREGWCMLMAHGTIGYGLGKPHLLTKGLSSAVPCLPHVESRRGQMIRERISAGGGKG